MLLNLRFFLAVAFCSAALLTAPLHGAAAASAYDTLQVGPPVGAKIPHNLKTVDHNNQHQDFKSLAHSRGPVILFSRSLDW